MKHSLVTVLALVAAMSAAGPSAVGAERETAPAPAPPKKAAPAAPAGGDGLQRLAREFGEKRADILDGRKALLERLRLAKTDEEKQRIVTEIRQLQQQRLDEQREQARLIREQLLSNRETRRGS